MNSVQKTLTIFGTRPEAIKLFPLAHKLADDARFESKICVSAQHRSMLDQVLEISGVAPDFDLDLMRPDQSLDELVATLLVEIGKILDAEKPDWVIVQGDTATAMAGAMAAYFRKIRVAHVEAGLRSGDIYHPWPEEVNRKIIGNIAALHCAPTKGAAQALLDETVAESAIVVTGNTVIDALHWVVEKTENEPAGSAELDALEERFAGKRVIGVTCHRRENFGQSMVNIAKAIRELASRDDVAVIFPVHLNPNVRAVMNEHLEGVEDVALIEPLDYTDFVRLLKMANIMLTDSGGIQEEAPALGKPVLVMRETTERPEGVEAGTAKLVGTSAERIVKEVQYLLDSEDAYLEMSQAHNPFGDGKASARIADELAKRNLVDA